MLLDESTYWIPARKPARAEADRLLPQPLPPLLPSWKRTHARGLLTALRTAAAPGSRG